ncbi:hydroxymethylglutaryl-CoA lyase, mitochondrial [Quercus suber]|uniref:hydroxymethylglutaryl-CoA lyase, mitochondrial n=1 Tax=Quercus suber TaxID=58331 RepID=UPI0032DE98A4
MLAARGLDKFSRNSKFLVDRIVSVMPILEEPLGVTNHSMVGADTLKSHEYTREAFLQIKQIRNVYGRDMMNVVLASVGGNYQALGNARSALCSVNRPYSTAEFSNKFLKSIPGFVKIVEVGPRDGLQNESNIVPTAVKIELIKRLVSSGLPVVEATSFVSPKWVPQVNMDFVVYKVDWSPYSRKSVRRCVTIFLSSTLKFLLFYLVYIFIFPGTVIPMLEAVMDVVPVDRLAVHFHDTYGQALSNILVSLQMGISTVDSSVSGLGGCPYAKGASGNVATEDVVYMLHGLGVKTNVNLGKLMLAGDFISKHLGRPSGSKTAVALSKATSNASKL